MSANEPFNKIITYKLTEEEIAEKFKDVKPYPRNTDGIMFKNNLNWYMRGKKNEQRKSV